MLYALIAIMLINGDYHASILDRGLSGEDCLQAMLDVQPLTGVSLVCEVEQVFLPATSGE